MNYRLITVLPLATSADRFLPVPNKSYALLLHIEYGSACFKDRLSLKNDFLLHKKSTCTSDIRTPFSGPFTFTSAILK